MITQKILRFIYRSLLLLFLLTGTGFFAWGQAILTEHFDYGANNANLVDATTNWICTPTCSNTNPIQYVAGTNLSLGTYPQTGGRVTFTTTGQDVNRTFTQQTTGAVYASFLMNITSAQAAGDYFFHLGPNPISTAFHSRVFVRSQGSGFEIGIQKGATGTPNYHNAIYNFNTTYLVVVKYEFNNGSTTDDVSSLFIFSGNAPATEPSPIATNNAGNDFSGVGAVAIRQGTAANAPAGSIDYIRVATNWLDVTSAPPSGPTFTLTQGSNTINNNNSPAFNMGSVVINNNLDVTFTITNNGTAALNITTPITVSGAGYSIQAQPANTVGFNAPNNTTTFVVRFNSATAISNSPGTVIIQHNAAGGTFTLNLVATATASASPTIAVSQGANNIPNNNSPAFNMGSVVINNNLDVTFTITNNGTANLNITTPIGISGTGFTIQTQPASTVGFNAPNNTTTFVVRFNSATAGTFTGTVTIQNNAGPNYVINLSATANVPLANFIETFNSNCFGSFTTFSVTGDQSWQCVNFGINPTNSPMAQMNGFAFGAPRDNQDWLISPLITVTATSVLSFYTQASFTGQNLTVRISEDYIDGNPNTATWVDITSQANPALPQASGSSTPSAWVQSFINLSAYAGKSVRIAFVYVSISTGNAGRWSVDDIQVTNAEFFIYTTVQQLPNIINTTTSVQNYRIVSNGVNSVTVTPPAGGIEISKNNSSGFTTNSLTFNASELATNPQVFVRYRPATSSKQVVLGNITNTVGSKTLNVRVRAIDRTQTLDVVTLNTLWFSVSTPNGGGNELGPSDNALQVENLKQTILLLDADIYALQEVGNDDIGGGVRGFDKLAADLAPLGYTAIRSPHPEVFNPNDDPGKIQRLGFVYRTSMFSNVKTRVMIDGATIPPDYPGTAARFFSGRRFPWLLTADVTLGGHTRRVNFINFHARANGTETTTDQLYAMRRYDVNILKDTLDQRFNGENVILLGDYNDEINFTIARGIQTPAFQNTTESSWKSFADDTQGYSIVTRNLSANGFISFLGGAYAIDHITLSNELAGNLIANSPISENMLPLINNYRNTLSDHLPVSASLDWAITPATNTGIITTSTNSLDFGEVVSGQTRELTYTLSGSNLTGNITVSSSSSFYQIARGSGNFVNSLVIPASELASPQEIRVRFAPNSNNDGTRTANITHVGNSGNITPRAISLTGVEKTQATALEQWLEKSLSVYPNPTTDIVEVKLAKNRFSEIPKIQLLTADGKIIFEKNLIENAENFESTINLSNFTKGFYLIKLHVGNLNTTRKILVK
ncbi:MAG: choice-of-anchor J domain-containing protein [Microscillaceae bacterium]|nr:choice-of-anchor J domain-containing protein [Microscillaceae bacterium]MDW8460720.1 choice-of-anchor J domain-containing protein [Cytophagales bacterium]